MGPSASIPRREAHRRRAAGALLLLLLASWLAAGLHFALEAHDHDACADRWVHRDAAQLDLCCDHGAGGVHAGGGKSEREPDPAGELHAAEFAGHGHLCAVVDLLVPLFSSGGARLGTRGELRHSPGSAAPRQAVDEREPRYRLAPKGSPPAALPRAV